MRETVFDKVRGAIGRAAVMLATASLAGCPLNVRPDPPAASVGTNGAAVVQTRDGVDVCSTENGACQHLTADDFARLFPGARVRVVEDPAKRGGE